MTRPISPYYAPDFYSQALAKGRHRDIVGGRWEETGLVQMQAVLAAGLEPHHHFLDIGAGSLRLGCRLVPYLQPGHYWATDLSRALMLRGYDVELADQSRLNPEHLVEDADFGFPGLPQSITHALAFAVFTHLPLGFLEHGLHRIATCFPRLEWIMFTVFLAGTDDFHQPVRQPDGVVTHPDRTPYHFLPSQVLTAAHRAGLTCEFRETELPRGQVLCFSTRN